jgi:PAB-dependent poly(A)-specific ribonuclease subunit 2
LQEELEIRSDGTKQVLRPSKMSLARVSVLRGEGPKEGEPFIDDYIHTSERVVDYLTEFSGIKGEARKMTRCCFDGSQGMSACFSEGDLDPHQSPYTVVPLKAAYKKLRLRGW